MLSRRMLCEQQDYLRLATKAGTTPCLHAGVGLRTWQEATHALIDEQSDVSMTGSRLYAANPSGPVRCT